MMRSESSDKSIRSKSVVKKIANLTNPKKQVIKKQNELSSKKAEGIMNFFKGLDSNFLDRIKKAN